ncbi:hypothetical protein ABWH88_06835 [Marinobacter adhaerens]|uniref:hypothetical protein n=1 Tax=Marinobacter adhaerens TaxID=1033846 RepID=UPI0035CF0620
MIYTVGNTVMIGKPVKVFVNGNKVDGAYYADTERGIVEFYPQPPRIKKPERDQVYSRTLRGKVTVEPMEQA